ncbi:hypothetical protein ABID29_002152 [Streptococcus rupicaprae]|uniref:Uncharacterized protein n=1 Tax=Streptococcus rupicaprae TaxID=759619 RepID=A0ABV2FKG6_9STRE
MYHCKRCQLTFNASVSANFSVLCVNCFHALHSESDYGYGSVTPFYFWLGDDLFARLLRDDNGYYWIRESSGQLHRCQADYLEAV